MAIIELGLDRAGPPDTRTFRTRPRWPNARLWRLVVALAVVVATLGGAAVTGRPVPAYASVPLPPGSSFRLTGDAIYVAASVRNGTEISAYTATGGFRWGYGLASPTDFVSVTPTRPAALVQYGEHPIVLGLDPATGDRLWLTVGAEIFYTTADRVLLATQMLDGTEVAWSDARTGDTLWSVKVDQTSSIGIGDPAEAPGRSVGPGHLYVVTADGNVRDLTLADEPAERDSTIAKPARRPPLVFTVGDRLLVVGLGRSLAQVQAYDTAGFQPLWTHGYSGGGIGAPSMTVVPCAAVLCEVAGDDVYGVAPDTGVLTWDMPGSAVRTAGAWLLATPASPAVDATGRPGIGIRVLDATSGATLLELPGWQLSWASAHDGAVLLADGGSTGLTQLATIDPGAAAPRLSVVGAVPRVTGECQRTAGFVGCPTGNRLSVWRG